jgi:hypothetical protein
VNERSKKLAGILLIVLPTVAYGGATLLNLLIENESGYVDNPLRQDLWRAGHAHAGVLLILSLVILRYVDHARLSETTKQLVRSGTPISAILIPVAFFLSVVDPGSTKPNNLIYLAYAGVRVADVNISYPWNRTFEEKEPRKAGNPEPQ